MRPQGSQKLCKTIETCRSVLKSLLCSCRRHLTSIELEIVKKPLKLSSRPSKLPPVRRKRLLADLQDALRRVEQLDVPSKPPQRQRASSGRARLPPERYGSAKTPKLDWELRRATSRDDRVLLGGDPVVLDYGERRAPSGFRDAETYMSGLGSGTTRELPSRGERAGSTWSRPAAVMVLASIEASGKQPWKNDWEDITDDPSRALCDAAYVQV